MDPIDKKYYGASYTLAHMMARVLLFHDDPIKYFDLFQKLQGSEVTRQWYTPNFYGNVGPFLLALERANVPVIEVPLAHVQVINANYDLEHKQFNLTYRCRSKQGGELHGPWGTIKLSCEGEGPIQINVSDSSVERLTP
jgi:hypothetical protein